MVLRSLNRFADGAYPYARLAAGGDGALYGNGRQGGANDDGTVFRMNKDGSGFAVLRSFHRTPDGSFLSGALSEGGDGALYGTALQGGAVGSGTVYRMNKDGTGFAVLRNFSGGSEGATLFAGVVEGSDGGLYGVTRDGGVNNAGTLFRVNKDGTGFSSLMRFALATDGSSPQAGVIESRDGMLYGTAQGAGLGFGTVYRMNRDGTGAVVLRRFNGGTDGLSPQAVVEGTDGLIYGTTLQGGLYGSGTIYRMNRDGTGFVAIRSFTGGSDGGYLYGALAEGSDGMFYGTGNQGGAYGQGTVFRMNKDGTGFAVLNVFNGSSGSRPFAGVIEGTDGAIYGTTISGGAVGYGVVFRMNKNGTGYTVLRSFSATEGIYPYGGVVEGSDGALYGANNQGGVYGAGTVYRINKDGSGFAVLRSLNQNPDGAYPQYGVREGSDGALYGTGTQGGTSGGGTVYRLNKDGTGFEVLQAMGTTAGSPRNPTGKLAFGSDGRFYGTSAAGGDANLGTIFALQIVPPNQAPSLANPGNRSVNELTTLAFALSATDGNAGDTLTYAIASGAQPGMNLGTANGAFSWTPTEAQGPGVYTVTFRVTDLAGATSSQTISIAVNEVNTAPTAVPLSLTTAEDVPVAVTLTGNDADIPANTLVSTVLASPTHGVLAANAGGFTYTPATNYNGPDSFTFVVNDGTTDSVPATVTLDVTPANDPPVAVADAYTTGSDAVLNVGVPGLLANDTDADRGPLLTFQFEGHMILADADFTAGQRFTGYYSLNPAAVGVQPADATLTRQYVTENASWEIFFPEIGYRFTGALMEVDAGNNTAYGDRYIATLYATGTASVGTPLPSGRPISIAQFDLADPVSAGADLLQDNSIQSTTVDLALAQSVGGRFLFGGGSQPPLALDRLEGPMSVTGVNGVATNVNRPITLASGAILRVSRNGSLSYDPNGHFAHLGSGATAAETFTYEMSDLGGATATTTATITVTGVNDAPVAANDSYNLAEDMILSAAANGVLANDSDVDGDPLTAVLVNGTTHGTLALQPDGRFTYTSAANYNGPDSFTYKANDGTVDSAPATVSINVTPVNDAPVAANDGYVAVEDQPLVVAAGVGGPAHGGAGKVVGTVDRTATFDAVRDGTDLDGYTEGQLRVSVPAIAFVSDGALTGGHFYPNAGANGATSIRTADGRKMYALEFDTMDGWGSSHTLHLHWWMIDNGVVVDSGVFDSQYTAVSGFSRGGGFDELRVGAYDTLAAAVSATPASYQALGLDNLKVQLGAPGVLANDSDADGNPLTAVLVSGPTHGTLALQPDGGFTYTPAANYNGPDSFTYRANDGTADSGIARVSIDVTAVNDAPVAANDGYNLAEDLILSVASAANGVLANDSDPDGDPLTAVLVAGPTHGTLALQPDGRFTYTPAANYNGPDSFTYKANDGTADSATATVGINVTPVNDGPVAGHPVVTTAEDTATSVTLAGSDVDGDALAYAVTTVPTHGTLSGTAPNLTYTPWPNWSGPDAFGFQVGDGFATAAGVVGVTVTPANDAPVANPLGVTTAEDIAVPVVLSVADVEAVGYSVLQVFGSDATAGQMPSAGLIEGSGGMLYGTTEFGGASGNGTVFRVNRDGSGHTTLHGFAANGSEGAWPRGRLAAGPGGMLYGTTAIRGNANGGTVWKMKTDGTAFGVLQHFGFSSPSVRNLSAGVMLGSDGKLYGTTVFGGAADAGTVFQVGTDGSGAVVLHAFTGLANGGGRPYAQLVEGPDGALLGTTEVGGSDANGGGTVFRIQKDGSGFGVVHAFAGGTGDGGTLRRGLLLGGDGTLHGVTTTGGPGNGGTVFRVRPDGTGFQLVHFFASNGAEGKVPQATLAEGPGGVLYGATYSNGAYFGGTVYRMNRDGTGFGVLHHFRSGTADGHGVQGDLLVGGDGLLYGTTTGGTATDAGELFRLGTEASGLTYTLASAPAHGTLSGTAPNLVYTPAANFNGPDSFTFKANDGTADSGVATVSITVTPVNDVPVAGARSVTTAEDTAAAIALAGSDVDGDALAYTVGSAPAHGTLSGTAPNLTYTPAANYHGPDRFTYAVGDGLATSAPATVTITVTPVSDGDPGDVDAGPASSADGPVFSTTPQPDGKLVVGGGFTMLGGVARNFLGRLNGDGTVDAAFNPNANGQVNGVAVQRDGKIVVGGGFTTLGGAAHNRLARLNADGTVDAAFNPDVGHQVLAMALQADGRIIIGGYFTTVNGSARNYIARLNADGTLDAGFNPNANGFVYGSAALPDGRIVVGGNFTGIGGVARNYTARLNADGSVDAGFNPNTDGSVRSTVLQPDGKLVIGGNFYTVGGSPRGSVARLNPDGTLDTGFNPNADAVVHTVALQTDGKLVIGGAFSTVGGQESHRVARINPDGTLDGTFNPDVGGASPSVFSAAVQADGKVFVGGIFGTVGGLVRANLARLSNDAATQALTVSGPERVQWLRGGTSPEAQEVGFESSKDGGATWTSLGSGTRISGGWEKTGLNLTGNGQVRARARLTGGYYNGSSGLAEATVGFAFNTAPVANAQTVTAAEDTATTILLAGSDAEGDTLAFAVLSVPSHGTLNGTAPNLTYTPAPNYHGADSFTFRVNDGTVDSATATVSIAVTPVNDAPVAANDGYNLGEDMILSPAAAANGVLANDSDVDGDPLTAVLVSGTTHGTLALQPDGRFTYTPAANYNGPDSFSYKANDGAADSGIATVTINVIPVNDAPVAVGDAYTTDEDHAIDVASPGLLANDSDPDAGPLVKFAFAGQVRTDDGEFRIGDRFTGFYMVDPAATGFDIANSSLRYQYRSDRVPWEISFPGRGYRFVAAYAYTWIYVGNDTLGGDRYIASLTGSSSVGTPLPSGRVLGTTQIDLWDPTSAGADLLTDDSVQTTSIGLAAALIPAGRMGFPDGSSVSLQIDQLVGPLTISEVNGQAASVGARIQLPSGALLRLNGNGSFRYDPNGSFEGLRAGATASDSFVYKVIDPEGAAATATATITVTGVNDQPLATAQAVSTAEDTAVAITLGGSDAEGDALAFAIVTPPTHGTLGGTAPRLTYTPAANYNGPDSFTFRANDGTVDSATATVSIDVIPVNDLPVAANDSYNLGEDMTLSLASAANGVLANDSDLDGDPLTAVLVAGPTHGTLALQPDGRFTYTPAANYNGPDGFTYKANDGTADSGVATVSLNVIPVNDVPAPNPQAVTTAEDTAVAITLSGSDVDGDVLGYTVASGPAHGTLGGTAPNLLYTPAADYHGPDAFVFGVDDGHGGMATATVAITVTDVLMGLSSISPASATAGGNGFTLTVEGSGFEPDTVGYWNGNARPTTYVSPTRVTVAISSGDLAGFTDIQTASVTVGEPTGPESGVAVFAIVPASVGEVQASVVPAGSTAEVTSPPATATEPGVSASVANNGGAPVTVVVATYDTKPTGTTVFKVDGGSFVDVQLTGADSGDAATVKFYYPASVTGGKENSVKLRYFDGANWIAVLGSGGVAPAKDTADNLDGTVSGGRFTVVFDNTSTPKITELNGTILGMIDPAPQVLSVDGPTGPLVLGSGANVGVTYATPAPGQACQVTYDWDDGTTSTVAGNNGAAAASHAYATAGVYTVVATVRDANGATGSGKHEFVVIYDPAGGFVTGGGWILSPAGAYAGDLAATGKANFGFVSKYQKGQTIPTGNTEFQLQCAAFNFQSTAYQWLVVSGAMAQYKGNGQINGSGDYGFLLTAGDGQAAGGSGTDKFRIKIWDKASGGVVYDNRKGSPDDLDAADPQAIGGGSIVIQKSK